MSDYLLTPEELIPNWKELREKNNLCDVTIVIGERRFSANKILLAASCPYFKSMFTSSFIEKDYKEVHINEVNPNGFQHIINLLYNNLMEVNETNIHEMLQASDFLQMHKAKKLCWRFLEENMSPKNCLSILDAACLYSNEELEQLAAKFILDHFDEFMLHDEFLQIPIDDLVAYFNHKCLRVECEDQILSGIKRWIEHDPSTRSQHLDQILKTVHWDKLSPSAKTLTINEQKITPPLMSNPPIFPRSYLFERAFVFGGRHTRRSIDSSEIYDVKANKWTRICSMPEPLRFVTTVPYKDKIFVFGYCDQDKLFTTWYLDVENKCWNKGFDIDSTFKISDVIVFRKCFYFIGIRNNKHEVTTYFEKYDPEAQRWTSFPPMNLNTRRSCLVTVGQDIYAIGFCETKKKNFFKRFNHRTYDWFDLKTMSTIRKDFGAVVYKEKIYVAGGIGVRSCKDYLNSVEVYDLKLDNWNMLPPMQITRAGLSLCIICNKMYALGGVRENVNVLFYAECFDFCENKWSSVRSMIFPKAYFGACVVRV